MSIRLIASVGMMLLLIGCDLDPEACASPTAPCQTSPQLSFLGPASPDDLAAQVQAADVLLTWTPLEAGMSVSVTRRAQSGGAFPAPFREIGSLASDLGVHTDAGVEPGGYEYRLRRCGASGKGSARPGGACTVSNIVLVTVDGPSGRPSAPAELSAEASADTVFLSWQNVTYAETIVVQRSAADGLGGWTPWQPITMLEGVAERYEDTPAGPGMQRYRLRACNHLLCSMLPPYSNEAEVEVTVPPGAPSDLEATVEGLSVHLSWSPVHGATLIDITRQPGGDPLVWLERLSPDALSFEDEAPTPGTFAYQVHACNEYGCSESETSVDVTGAPPATHLSAVKSTTGSAHSQPDTELSWSNVVAVDEWRLYRRYWGVPESPSVSPSWEQLAVIAAGTNEFLDAGLPGTYEYRIDGCNEFACTESNAASIFSWANPLELGEPLNTLGFPGGKTYYKVVVPESDHDPSQADSWAMVRTMSGIGDLTLYVRRDSPPTPSDFDCVSRDRSGPQSNEEECWLSEEGGTWYVMLEGQATEFDTYLITERALTLKHSRLDGLAGERGTRQLLHVPCELLGCSSSSDPDQLYFQLEGDTRWVSIKARRARVPTLWQYDCFEPVWHPDRCELDFARESYWIELLGTDDPSAEPVIGTGYSGVSFTWGPVEEHLTEPPPS